MLAAAITASLTGTAMMPFAVVSDVVIAGIFSIVNTLLNAAIILLLSRTKRTAQETRQIADEAVDLAAKIARRTDSPRHNGERTRSTDGPAPENDH